MRVGGIYMFITIVGTSHYFGTEIFKVGQNLWLEKDVNNDYDEEAIKVVTEAGATVGYVANSVYSVAKGTRSAGRIYDTFEGRQKITVCFIVKNDVIAQVDDEISF